MRHRKTITGIAVVGAAASAILVGSIASSSAATSDGSSGAAPTADVGAHGAPPDGGAFGGPGGPGSHRGPGGPGGHRGGPGHGGPGSGGIHSETVVAQADGSGFTTLTSDSGTLTASSGRTLTLKQGTADETWGTNDVEVPKGATVRRNGEEAELGDLKRGDHVRVQVGPHGSFVDATTAAFEKERKAEHEARHARMEANRPAAPTWPSV